jgi:hypothetical protein
LDVSAPFEMDENSGPGIVWYVKRLSGNDTLANRSNQAGPYIPTKFFLDVFPSLNRRQEKNPDKRIDLTIDSHSDARRVRAVWYNSKYREPDAKKKRDANGTKLTTEEMEHEGAAGAEKRRNTLSEISSSCPFSACSAPSCAISFFFFKVGLRAMPSLCPPVPSRSSSKEHSVEGETSTLACIIRVIRKIRGSKSSLQLGCLRSPRRDLSALLLPLGDPGSTSLLDFRAWRCVVCIRDEPVR